MGLGCGTVFSLSGRVPVTCCMDAFRLQRSLGAAGRVCHVVWAVGGMGLALQYDQPWQSRGLTVLIAAFVFSLLALNPKGKGAGNLPATAAQRQAGSPLASSTLESSARAAPCQSFWFIFGSYPLCQQVTTCFSFCLFCLTNAEPRLQV